MDTFRDLPDLQLNLARFHMIRFMFSGDSTDLKFAAVIYQRIVDSLPHKDPRRVISIARLSGLEFNIAQCLWDDAKYAEQALQHLREAQMFADSRGLGLTPESKLELKWLIGSALSMAGRRDEAMESMRTITRNFPKNGAEYAASSYFSLSDDFLKKWNETQDREALDDAIETARHSVEIRKDGSKLSLSRGHLSQCLRHRYKSTGDEKDLKEAGEVLQEGSEMSASLGHDEFHTAQVALDIFCDLKDWERVRNLSFKMADLVVILSAGPWDSTDEEVWLHRFLKRIPTYASIALEAGSNAFEVIDMLENCRGSILGGMIDNRTDLDDLKKVAPDKAERFNALREEINREISSSSDINVTMEQMSRRSSAAAGIRASLNKIRNVEGFHRFLLGPTQNELKIAAASGPILIVNISKIRSDAIIITKGNSVLLHLPEVEYKKVAEFQKASFTDSNDLKDLRSKNKKYLQFLKWLWDKCVMLIVRKLDELVPKTDTVRVWWLGIGIAGSLPFHAAGSYTSKVCESALSRAISSYTASMKFLMHDRRKLKKDPRASDMQCLPQKPKMLIVSMPSTPGMSDLSGVSEEVEQIEKIVQGSYSAQHCHQSNAKEVMKHMEKCEVIHFACHGQSILRRSSQAVRDPLTSHLCLQATFPGSLIPILAKLTVRDVIALNLNHAKLAVLSACSTAENKYDWLWEETLHLAAGFQVAGYLHTFGNLWPADDEVSVKIVTGFYRHLVAGGELGSGENVAKALNKAVVDVMRERPRQPLSWASFVHFGV